MQWTAIPRFGSRCKLLGDRPGSFLARGTYVAHVYQPDDVPGRGVARRWRRDLGKTGSISLPRRASRHLDHAQGRDRFQRQ